MPFRKLRQQKCAGVYGLSIVSDSETPGRLTVNSGRILLQCQYRHYGPDCIQQTGIVPECRGLLNFTLPHGLIFVMQHIGEIVVGWTIFILQIVFFRRKSNNFL